MTQDKLPLQALGVALGQLKQFFSDGKECDALLVEAVSPVPMFAALVSYGTSTSCQRRQDFVELAKGIVFAACTSGFQLENRPDRALIQKKANPGPLSPPLL